PDSRHKKAQHPVRLFYIGVLLVLLISCCPFLALFSYFCFLETSNILCVHHRANALDYQSAKTLNPCKF
ncbi:hypothetical protein, partial [Acinetobacter baumannii]|uniref:hypothetical protein n=1 Tax=Acinetobacter baumannii TaxID=470 RepID=UPI003B439317